MAVAIKPDPDIKHLMLQVEILAVKTNLATMLRSTRQPPAVTSTSMVLAVSETPAHSLMVNKSSEISTTRFPQRFCRDFSRTKVLTQVILNNLSHMLLDHLWTTTVVLLAAMFLEVAVAATEVVKMEDSPAEVDIEEVAMAKANTQDPWMLTQAPTSRHPSARTSIVVRYFIITNHIIGFCRYSDKCSFAHGDQELRKTFPDNNMSRPLGGQSSPQYNFNSLSVP